MVSATSSHDDTGYALARHVAYAWILQDLGLFHGFTQLRPEHFTPQMITASPSPDPQDPRLDLKNLRHLPGILWDDIVLPHWLRAASGATSTSNEAEDYILRRDGLLNIVDALDEASALAVSKLAGFWGADRWEEVGGWRENRCAVLAWAKQRLGDVGGGDEGEGEGEIETSCFLTLPLYVKMCEVLKYCCNAGAGGAGDLVGPLVTGRLRDVLKDPRSCAAGCVGTPRSAGAIAGSCGGDVGFHTFLRLHDAMCVEGSHEIREALSQSIENVISREAQTVWFFGEKSSSDHVCESCPSQSSSGVVSSATGTASLPSTIQTFCFQAEDIILPFDGRHIKRPVIFLSPRGEEALRNGVFGQVVASDADLVEERGGVFVLELELLPRGVALNFCPRTGAAFDVHVLQDFVPFSDEAQQTAVTAFCLNPDCAPSFGIRDYILECLSWESRGEGASLPPTSTVGIPIARTSSSSSSSGHDGSCTDISIIPLKDLHDIKTHTLHVSQPLSEKQKQAIALCRRRPPPESASRPILIRGPPGTGKTFLAADIIYNWYLSSSSSGSSCGHTSTGNNKTESSILAAAPTNVGANVLLAYLMERSPMVAIRVGAIVEEKAAVRLYRRQWFDFLQRRTNDVKGRGKLEVVLELLGLEREAEELAVRGIEGDELELIFQQAENVLLTKTMLKGKQQCLSITTLPILYARTAKFLRTFLKYLLNTHPSLPVVTTNDSASSFLLRGKTFENVLLDEAGTATVPSSLVPLQHLSQSSKSRLVFVGDEFQLPPVVGSDRALQMGLGKSLFEILVARARAEAEHDEHPPTQVSTVQPVLQLDKQRRMHPTLAAFPFAEFYNEGSGSGVEDAVDLDKLAEISGWPWTDIQGGGLAGDSVRVSFVDTDLLSSCDKIGVGGGVASSSRLCGEFAETEAVDSASVQLDHRLYGEFAETADCMHRSSRLCGEFAETEAVEYRSSRLYGEFAETDAVEYRRSKGNVAEAMLVADCVAKVFGEGGVRADQIGIITPYREQRKLILDQLRTMRALFSEQDGSRAGAMTGDVSILAQGNGRDCCSYMSRTRRPHVQQCSKYKAIRTWFRPRSTLQIMIMVQYQ